ncbi:MAG: hypothetical protein HW412_466, partial [Bacteroidetes bacterium]|nr:hypothetical protein [Bacteroidota bacterium]
MKHDQYKEWLQLLMYDELTADEHSALDQHLRTCGECRQELEELKKFHSTLAQAGALATSDDLLGEARQELRAALRAERSTPPLWNRRTDFVMGLIPNYKIAFGSVAILVVGILIGKTVLSPVQQQPIADVPTTDRITASLEGDTRISNVRFVDSDASDGEVEFTFDALSPVHVKGSINDERVQRVLAHAL